MTQTQERGNRLVKYAILALIAWLCGMARIYAFAPKPFCAGLGRLHADPR